MSLRNVMRIVTLAAGLVLGSPLAGREAALWLPLIGLGLLGLSLGYLVLLAGGGDRTRWQLRYHLPAEATLDDPSGQNLEHLEAILRFLADRTGHLVVEANARGLFLELPAGFDRYVEAQFPRALPEVRLSRDKGQREGQAAGSFLFSVGPLSPDLLRWATEHHGRRVRLHVHQGPVVTATAQTDGTLPPGRWLRVPVPRPFRRLWQHLPLWDELSAGIRLSSLFPTTDGEAPYSSRSRLLRLLPPDDYQTDPAADGGGRTLGQSTAGHRLTLSYELPLFTVAAPASFLSQQVLDDLEAGRAVVVVSPHRHLLDRIAQQAGEAPVYWLDSQSGHRSAHLPIISAQEWATQDVETVVEATQTFLSDLGLHVDLPAVGDFTRHLIQVLARRAQRTQSDLPFTELCDVSQSTQALRASLTEVQGSAGDLARELLARLDHDAGYVQAVTILSAIRTALKPLSDGPLRSLCQGPFLNASQVLRESSLLLVPLSNADFPEHDRLLGAMLDLTLRRLLATKDDLALALHLHDPHLYRNDGGQRWIDLARQDPRLSLLLDTAEPEAYHHARKREAQAELIFRFSEALASSIIEAQGLPASVADLLELPLDTAVALLPGMVVALHAGNTNEQQRRTA